MLAVMLAGAIPTSSDSSRLLIRQRDQAVARKREAGQTPSPLNYRSPGATHKIVIRAEEAEATGELVKSRLARRSKRFGSYYVVEVGDEALGAAQLRGGQLRDDFNLLMLRRGQMDTTAPEPAIDPEMKISSKSPGSLHLVQLFGPPTPDSVARLKATGARVVSYIPNNAYMVWASAEQLARIADLRRGDGIVQWDGPYHPAYKIAPQIRVDDYAQIATSIQILDTPEAAATIARIKQLAVEVLMDEFTSSGITHIKARIESYKAKEFARMPEVLAIEPWAEMKPMDERASQISAGAISSETTNNIQVLRPTAPGYLAFLNSLGFNSDFDFAVDIGDTGFDLGSQDAARMHPDFLNSLGQSRIAYLHDFSSDSHTDPNILPAHDTNGHGTLNASIIGGFNNGTESAFADPLGFRYGLGIAPFARIGVTKVFDDSGSFTRANYHEFISSAYRNGARISSNSWGACDTENGFCNLYTDDDGLFDILVRDADPDAPGNQSMTIVFSCGNDGEFLERSISTPGSAKNVISVGASENFRADGGDGCAVGNVEADNANDIVEFSSRGPTQYGSGKPDLVAPGTHVQGAASQDAAFATKPAGQLGVCNRFFPAGQTRYTWSSGTSHAAPQVAGAAALAYQWLSSRLGIVPSPALVKAFILNSTSYLTGRFGGGNLPGANQGWGLLNLARMFEATDRIVFNESPERLFTVSGGQPFETAGLITDSTKEFRVMLVWSDPPGNAATNAPFVNQLNLEVVIGGVVYSGNNFSGQYSRAGAQNDIVNNVQAVRLPAGTTGPFIVRVRPTIIAGDGVPQNGIDLDQDFALVVTNGRESAVPVLAIEGDDVSNGVTVLHQNGASDQSLIPGETARITVTLRNLSQAAAAEINSARLTINQAQADGAYGAIQPGLSLANTAPFQIQVPSDLRCGSVATLNLQVETQVGRFVLPVRVRVGRQDGATQELLSDDVDGGRVKWKKKRFGMSTTLANSGSQAYHAVDPGKEDEDNLLGTLTMKKTFAIPENAGGVRLSFFHVFNFEPGYDGGVLEISDDSGATWRDAGPLIITGGYDGTVTEASNNPLGTRLAWTARGRAGVFSQVVINLDEFAGKRVKLRFTAGFDNATGVLDGYTGWFIDDIRVTANLYKCQ
jgi:hypothetical protein